MPDGEERRRAAVEHIAAWTSSLSFAALPEAVVEAARRCVIDTVGVAVAGLRTEPARIARRLCEALAGPGESTVLGSRGGRAAAGAAFANGAAAHAIDFDDNCYAGLVHGSAVILPTAVAVAEAQNASGSDLLTAFVAGSEAEYAIGAATTPALYDRGWWTTAVLGPVGAAAAAARILGLDAARTASAIGIALAGAGGAKACFGTDGKPLLAGRAAEAGVVAALAAREGAVGPARIVEASQGFAALFNGGDFDADCVDRLGASYRLIEPGIDVKRIPICLSAHAAVDAFRDILRERVLAASEIASIGCDVPPVVVANLTYDRPVTARQAQFSLPFALAATLLFGDVRLEDLTDDVVRRPEVLALMTRVSMTSGPAWAEPGLKDKAPEGAFLTIRLVNGEELTSFRARPDGAASLPLSLAELEAKFLACTVPTIGESQARALLIRLRDVAGLPSARDLLSGCRLYEGS